MDYLQRLKTKCHKCHFLYFFSYCKRLSMTNKAVNLSLKCHSKCHFFGGIPYKPPKPKARAGDVLQCGLIA